MTRLFAWWTRTPNAWAGCEVHSSRATPMESLPNDEPNWMPDYVPSDMDHPIYISPPLRTTPMAANGNGCHVSPPTLDESVAEAASQALGKLSKMDVARQAVLTKQFAEIAADEMKDVRRLKAKHLGPHWADADKQEEKDVNGPGFLICDDYRVYNGVKPADVEQRPQSVPTVAPVQSVASRVWPWVVGTLLGTAVGGGVGVGVGKLLKPTPANTTIEKTQGFLIDLIGEKPK